jgi:GrpB-like predicted nucleotidyltransferase (UPF0157 family)
LFARADELCFVVSVDQRDAPVPLAYKCRYRSPENRRYRAPSGSDRIGPVSEVDVVQPRRWAEEFPTLADALAEALGPLALRIDHIGSTSVPGLPAKDVLDVQVTVADEDALSEALKTLHAESWPVRGDLHDHPVSEDDTKPDASQWLKGFTRQRPGMRRTNVHIRIEGRVNWRYALLFRDYLRAHPQESAAYGRFKQRAARLLPEDVGTYSDLKDPVCDLIYLPACRWAAASSWQA